MPAGTAVIRQREPGDEVYLLLKGSVDIVVEFAASGPIRSSEADPYQPLG